MFGGLQSPFVELLPSQEEGAGIADKIQYTGFLKPDGQKGVEGGGHDGRQKTKLRQRKNRDKTADTDDADVPEPPQPRHGLGFQVIGVDIHLNLPFLPGFS